MAEEPKEKVQVEQKKESKVKSLGYYDNPFVNPYNNVRELFQHFGILKRKADDWRLTEALPGHIHGLPNSQGTLLATNGILCLIERIGDLVLFEGHLDWFIPTKPSQKDLKTKEGDIVYEIGKKAREVKRQQIAAKLAETLLDL